MPLIHSIEEVVLNPVRLGFYITKARRTTRSTSSKQNVFENGDRPSLQD